MAKPTTMMKRYLWDLLFRLTVFLFISFIYLRDPQQLDFTSENSPRSLPLTLLWLAVLISMLAQLNPNSNLTTGCLKQYPVRCQLVSRYDPTALAQATRAQNTGAGKVAGVWLAIHLIIGVLYGKKLLSVSFLVLLCTFYFLCDLICVLFFCPFQTFLMKNRCCVNCRIFAWGSWMMAAPLFCVPHFYSWSLSGASIVVLISWEVRFRRHPERFWFGSNQNLQCAHCKEQLCRYKFPRTHA